MRQHVNPLSNNFHNVEIIPSLQEIFEDPTLPLHIDIGSAAGDFLFQLASQNKNWNYLGIEIREKLVKNAKLKMKNKEIQNLYFSFGNANNIFHNSHCQFLLSKLSSITFNFPDPWFKKKHFKRRIIQPDLINLLSKKIKKGTIIFIKTDVKDLFDYMDHTILENLNFKKLEKKYFNYSKSFNPSKIKTNREKYAITNQLYVFEELYTRV